MHYNHVRLYNATCRLKQVMSRSSVAKQQQTGHVLCLLSEVAFYIKSVRRGTLEDAADTQYRATVFRRPVHRFIV